MASNATLSKLKTQVFIYNAAYLAWQSFTIIQWNLSIRDTLGPEKQFVIQTFPLFRGYFIHITICLDPQMQSVIEVSTIRGVCYKRFHCTQLSPQNVYKS